MSGFLLDAERMLGKVLFCYSDTYGLVPERRF